MYNNLRLRRFDGSHLAFPGMTPHITLYPHQKDAVWRIMSSGNTLLAHAVGAGKTYVMAAAGMKMKQAGLIRKPLYVVPNNMLEQFGRECMQLYPNAQLLIAAKEDFTRERRKLLTAKMASGVWDGIITTQSSFERIGMSRAFRERFLREQSPPMTSSSATAPPRTPPARTATSSKRWRSRKPGARSASKICWPRRKKMTAWSSTSWALITSILTNACISRT